MKGTEILPQAEAAKKLLYANENNKRLNYGDDMT